MELQSEESILFSFFVLHSLTRDLPRPPSSLLPTSSFSYITKHFQCLFIDLLHFNWNQLIIWYPDRIYHPGIILLQYFLKCFLSLLIGQTCFCLLIAAVVNLKPFYFLLKLDCLLLRSLLGNLRIHMTDLSLLWFRAVWRCECSAWWWDQTCCCSTFCSIFQFSSLVNQSEWVEMLHWQQNTPAETGTFYAFTDVAEVTASVTKQDTTIYLQELLIYY